MTEDVERHKKSSNETSIKKILKIARENVHLVYCMRDETHRSAEKSLRDLSSKRMLRDKTLHYVTCFIMRLIKQERAQGGCLGTESR